MTTHGSRLLSLDAFRGITIAAMILVNMPGSWQHIYAPLRHADWHGLTPTDLIFPFFLFAVGISMQLSLQQRQVHGLARRYLHVLMRATLLLLIGLLINGFPNYQLENLRYTGVLQRIALCYLLAAPWVMHGNRLSWALLSAILLLGYYGLLHWGGDFTPTGNLVGHWDQRWLAGHVYTPTDPEGLLSTLPATATVLLGALTAPLLGSSQKLKTLTALLLCGGLLLVAGYSWHATFPLNKKLWSSSFVLFTAGAAMWLLALCHFIAEVLSWRRCLLPAVVFGRNAILAFILHALSIRLMMKVLKAPGGHGNFYNWLYETAFVPWAGPLNGSLAFALDRKSVV